MDYLVFVNKFTRDNIMIISIIAITPQIHFSETQRRVNLIAERVKLQKRIQILQVIKIIK